MPSIVQRTLIATPRALKPLRFQTTLHITLRRAFEASRAQRPLETVVAELAILREPQRQIRKRPVRDAAIAANPVAAEARVRVEEGAVGQRGDVARLVPVRLAAGVAALALQQVLVGADVQPVPRQEGALGRGSAVRAARVGRRVRTTMWITGVCVTCTYCSSSQRDCAPGMPSCGEAAWRQSSAEMYAAFSASVSVCLGRVVSWLIGVELGGVRRTMLCAAFCLCRCR